MKMGASFSKARFRARSLAICEKSPSSLMPGAKHAGKELSQLLEKHQQRVLVEQLGKHLDPLLPLGTQLWDQRLLWVGVLPPMPKHLCVDSLQQTLCSLA